MKACVCGMSCFRHIIQWKFAFVGVLFWAYHAKRLVSVKVLFWGHYTMKACLPGDCVGHMRCSEGLSLKGCFVSAHDVLEANL